MDFKEQYIFEMYKDKPLPAKKKFELEVASYGINGRDLFIKIVNYQVEKYGIKLTYGRSAGVPIDVLRRRDQKRKQSRLKTRGIDKQAKLNRWKEDI